jgi:sulfate/thiosulfate transport system permease protein
VVELSTPVKWLLRAVVVGYVFLLVGWPVITLVQNAFADGLASFQAAFADPDVIHALVVTLEISLWAVAINTVFGVGVGLLLVRYEFPGKRVLSALIDLPMSVSPVVIGLALLLVYNSQDGWFGPTLEAHGIMVIFNSPGMIMATCFVALPLVVREVVPVLSEIGDDQEQAARSLGANAFQTLRRITLPAIKWAIVYGVVLSLVRFFS